jgi:hypothetical protein
VVVCCWLLLLNSLLPVVLIPLRFRESYCIDNGSFVGQRPSAEALEGKFPEAPAADRKEGKQGSGSAGSAGGRDGADSDDDDDDNGGGGGGAGSAGGSGGGLSLDSVGTFARGEHKGDSKAASHQQRQQQARDHEQEALDVLQQQLERLVLRDSSSFAFGAGSAGAAGASSSSSSQQQRQQQTGAGQQQQHTAMRVSRAETEGVEWVDRR